MRLLVLLLVFLVPVLIAGSDCIVVEGERILASDLARANPVFSDLEPDRPLAYSPVVGVERVLSASEQRRLMELHGLGPGPAEDVCFERASELLTVERVMAALDAALRIPDSNIELMDFSRRPVPLGELDFDIAGLSSPGNRGPDEPVLWRGAVRYGSRRSVSVWARVRISVSRPRVVAVCDLPAGKPIRPGDVEVRTMNAFPEDTSPAETVDAVIGSLPRRAIPAGRAVYEKNLRTPEPVQRGDIVEVTVFSGAAQLQFDALAEATGRLGDSVVVSNPSNGARFSAEVSGRGQVVVRVGEHRDSSS